MNPPLLSYTAFGFGIASSVELPLQPVSNTHAPADVTIRFGKTPPPPTAPRDEGAGLVWITPGRFWLAADDVARYYVEDGRRIVVEPAGGNAQAIGLFLIDPVLAAVLMQRGVVPLHASAIAAGTGAVLFLGHSRTGKSSLLAAFAKRGYGMLADDVTGVVVRDGRAVAQPAFPNMRLRARTLDALALRTRAGDRVQAGSNKYWMQPCGFQRDPLSVRACFALAIGPRIAVAGVNRQAAFRLLAEHTYRNHRLPGSGLEATHFRTIAHVARSLPVFQLRRPVSPALIDALADQVENCLGRLREEWAIPSKAAAWCAREAGPGRSAGS